MFFCRVLDYVDKEKSCGYILQWSYSKSIRWSFPVIFSKIAVHGVFITLLTLIVHTSFTLKNNGKQSKNTENTIFLIKTL
jgi:hypothetical protein